MSSAVIVGKTNQLPVSVLYVQSTHSGEGDRRERQVGLTRNRVRRVGALAAWAVSEAKNAGNIVFLDFFRLVFFCFIRENIFFFFKSHGDQKKVLNFPPLSLRLYYG